MTDVRVRAGGRPRVRMIVEVHCHPFGPPAYRDLRDKIRSVPDLIGFRRNHPELYRAGTPSRWWITWTS